MNLAAAIVRSRRLACEVAADEDLDDNTQTRLQRALPHWMNVHPYGAPDRAIASRILERIRTVGPELRSRHTALAELPRPEDA